MASQFCKVSKDNIDRQQNIFKPIFGFFGKRAIDSFKSFLSEALDSGRLELELLFMLDTPILGLTPQKLGSNSGPITPINSGLYSGLYSGCTPAVACRHWVGNIRIGLKYTHRSAWNSHVVVRCSINMIGDVKI